jgi:mRNA interferase MazF
VSRAYVPDRGDLVRLSFSPQAGREQAGRRPGLVLSPAPYSRRAGLALICPVTSRIKGYPFEVPLEGGGDVAGVILADHLRSVDWRARKVEFIGRASDRVVGEVVGRLRALVGV